MLLQIGLLERSLIVEVSNDYQVGLLCTKTSESWFSDLCIMASHRPDLWAPPSKDSLTHLNRIQPCLRRG